MKNIYLISAFLLSFSSLIAQELVIEEGVGVGPLKLGQSFEEVVHILGFNGDLKTYDDYLAEELFFEDPENSLECAIGFDYYVKYEHLLTIPVSYIYFKDNVITQIKVSSFPEYYFAIASDTHTKEGLAFWEEQQKVESIYGTPDLTVNYDSFILESLFYFDRGITFNFREDNYRTAHIYQTSTRQVFDDFKDQF